MNKEYELSKYTYYFNKVDGVCEVNRLGANISRTVMKKVIISPSDIFDTNLEDDGRESVESSRNYVNNEYLMQYWIPFIGGNVAMTYVVIKRHAKENGYCEESISSLREELGVASASFRKYIDELESHGLIAKFNRLDEDGLDISPLIKVRMTIPVLPKHLLAELPKSLQERHDLEINL